MLASLSTFAASAPRQASLPWSDVNLLIVTDVHSWVAGHPHTDHTPALDADYGAVLSLYERLAASAAEAGRDLFFVQNGDLNDGTGLSRVPPATLLPLIQKMPFDALTTGNHELYKNETIEYLARPNGFVDSWNGAFLTSNVLNATTRQPLGARSKPIPIPTPTQNPYPYPYPYPYPPTPTPAPTPTLTLALTLTLTPNLTRRTLQVARRPRYWPALADLWFPLRHAGPRRRCRRPIDIKTYP